MHRSSLRLLGAFGERPPSSAAEPRLKLARRTVVPCTSVQAPSTPPLVASQDKKGTRDWDRAPTFSYLCLPSPSASPRPIHATASRPFALSPFRSSALPPFRPSAAPLPAPPLSTPSALPPTPSCRSPLVLERSPPETPSRSCKPSARFAHSCRARRRAGTPYVTSCPRPRARRLWSRVRHLCLLLQEREAKSGRQEWTRSCWNLCAAVAKESFRKGSREGFWGEGAGLRAGSRAWRYGLGSTEQGPELSVCILSLSLSLLPSPQSKGRPTHCL